MKKKLIYNENSIQALEGLDGVRENVDMYLGHQESQVFHCLREIVENTIDLWAKGLNDYCHIIIEGKKNQVFTVIDHGPGIPVGKNKDTGLSTLEVVLTRLHAGSNFHAKEEKKNATRGKHGVGSSCVNAVSSHLIASTFRDGICYSQEYKKGRRITDVKKVKTPVAPLCDIPKVKKGTVIQYKLDKEIMPDTVLSEKQMTEYARTVSALCKGLKVDITYNGKTQSFHNKKGIQDALDLFLEKQKKEIEFVNKTPFIYEGEGIQIALQWSSLPGEENVANYVNYASTPDILSTSVKGAFDIIGRVFKRVKLKGSDFSISDLREGMIMVLHYMCNNARYAGQNKEKLNTAEAVEDVKKLLEIPLTNWVKSNEKTVKKIIKRASAIKKAKTEAQKITQAATSLRATKKDMQASKKLKMCSSKCPPHERELIIVEGDSASGSLTEARNRFNQIILGLKGKPPNVMKEKSIAKLLANAEIKDLLIALGADIKKVIKGEPITEITVGKVLIASDADVDGNHIRTLVISILWRFARNVISAGLVHILKMPLYQAAWTVKGEEKREYGDNMQELKKIVPAKAMITRFKGLGEMSPEQMEPFANSSSKKRELIPISTIEAKKDIDEYNRLTGEDTDYRKRMFNIQ